MFTPVESTEKQFASIDLEYPYKIADGKLVTSDFGREIFGTVLMKDKPIATFQAALDEEVALDKPLKRWSLSAKHDFVKALHKKINELPSEDKTMQSYFLSEIAQGVSYQLLDRNQVVR